MQVSKEERWLLMEKDMILNYATIYREKFERGSLFPVSYLERGEMDLTVASPKESFYLEINGEATTGLFEWVDQNVNDEGNQRIISINAIEMINMELTGIQFNAFFNDDIKETNINENEN